MSETANVDSIDCQSETSEGDCKVNFASAEAAADSVRSVTDTEVNLGHFGPRIKCESAKVRK